MAIDPRIIGTLTSATPTGFQSDATVTYSFLTALPSTEYPGPYSPSSGYNNFTPFTEAQKAAVRKVLALLTEITRVTFVVDNGVRLG